MPSFQIDTIVNLAMIYQFESIMIILLILYALIYFIGKQQNKSILLNWLKSVNHLYQTQFSHIGTQGVNDKSYFEMQSINEYQYWASGRINCQYVMITHDLLKRQDLLSYLVQVFQQKQDQIVYQIRLDHYEQVVFGILRKKNHRTVYEETECLSNLTSKYPFESLKNNYIVFSENQQSIDHLLDSTIVQILQLFPKSIEQIIIKDNPNSISNHNLSNVNKYLSIQLVVNLSQDSQQLHLINKLVFNLIDNLATLKLSSKNKQQAIKDREIIEEIKSVQQKEQIREQLQKEKMMKKKQQEEMLKKSNPEKYKRMVEKEEKAQMQKRYRSKVVKM